MARFIFNTTAPKARGSTHPMIAARALRALRASDIDAPQRGPGWFDSSWDLQCGLDVREGLPGDAKLSEWLEVCLRS